eukprot:Platyproteum_vivax@DN3788_c0_g1_i2.p1
MDEWCMKEFSESGLLDMCKISDKSVSEVEFEMLTFLKQHCEEKVAVLGGNSVHLDRGFLLKGMPQLANHLHYRIIDVSSVRELALRWKPSVLAGLPPKTGHHRALIDIRDSIEELKFYKNNFICP